MHEAFYSGFVFVLVLTFTPLKVLGYLLPTLFTAWLILSGARGIPQRRVLALIGVVFALPVFYMFAAPEFLLANYALAVLTYSAFLPIFLIDSRAIASRELLARCTRAASTMVLLQGLVGTVQAAYGAIQTGSFAGDNGDIVAGTIYPHLSPERALSNPMFAVNMTLMIVVGLAVPANFGGRRRLHLAIGTVSLVLASVMHALVFLVGAAALGWLLTRASSRAARAAAHGRRLLFMLLLVSVVSYFALPQVGNISSVAEKAFDLDAVDVPRAILLNGVITELPERAPYQPLIGLGPGQFSSRASLIASGLYLGGPDAPKAVPFFSPQSTQLAADYCFSLLLAFAGKGDVIGSSQQPFFSALSIYTELGGIGLLLLVMLLIRWVRTVRQRVRHAPEVRFHGTLLICGIVFLFLIGLQDNYWEAPQAIFVGLLLLKLLYANVIDRQGEGESHASTRVVEETVSAPKLG